MQICGLNDCQRGTPARVNICPGGVGFETGYVSREYGAVPVARRLYACRRMIPRNSRGRTQAEPWGF